jgi:hypothetical protein
VDWQKVGVSRVLLLKEEKMKRKSEIERFFGKIDLRRDPRGCWRWTDVTRNGYGRFQIKGKKVTAHRYSYELIVGAIPEGLDLDHICRVRECVNPEHLEPKTRRQNLLAEGSQSSAAKAARKTHCDHGHPLSGDNLYRRRDNNCRQCIKCNTRRKAYYREQRRNRGAEDIHVAG